MCLKTTCANCLLCWREAIKSFRMIHSDSDYGDPRLVWPQHPSLIACSHATASVVLVLVLFCVLDQVPQPLSAFERSSSIFWIQNGRYFIIPISFLVPTSFLPLFCECLFVFSLRRVNTSPFTSTIACGQIISKVLDQFGPSCNCICINSEIAQTLARESTCLVQKGK